MQRCLSCPPKFAYVAGNPTLYRPIQCWLAPVLLICYRGILEEEHYIGNILFSDHCALGSFKRLRSSDYSIKSRSGIGDQ